MLKTYLKPNQTFLIEFFCEAPSSVIQRKHKRIPLASRGNDNDQNGYKESKQGCKYKP